MKDWKVPHWMEVQKPAWRVQGSEVFAAGLYRLISPPDLRGGCRLGLYIRCTRWLWFQRGILSPVPDTQGQTDSMCSLSLLGLLQIGVPM